MADSSSTPLRDINADEHAGSTDSDDMDYETAIDEEGDDHSDEDFLERFLDEGEDMQEDDGIETTRFS